MICKNFEEEGEFDWILRDRIARNAVEKVKIRLQGFSLLAGDGNLEPSPPADKSGARDAKQS